MIIPAYVLVAFIASLILLVITLLYLYHLYAEERDFQKEQEKVYKNSEKIIDEARKQANLIVEEAAQKAKHLVLDAEYVRSDLAHDIESSIKTVGTSAVELFIKDSKEIDEQYKEVFSQIKKEYSQHTQEALAALQKLAVSELDSFSKNLKKETLNSQVFIGARINEEFETKQKEIEAYKSQRLKLVDQTINEIIAKVAEEVLGKAIPIDEHEALVLEALEKAKKEEVFI
jgi:cell division septum initiation protein DivIVA